jgi:hypothetical protein
MSYNLIMNSQQTHQIVTQFSTGEQYPAFDTKQMIAAIYATGASDCVVNFQSRPVMERGKLTRIDHSLVVDWQGNATAQAIETAINVRLGDMGFGHFARTSQGIGGWEKYVTSQQSLQHLR